MKQDPAQVAKKGDLAISLPDGGNFHKCHYDIVMVLSDPFPLDAGTAAKLVSTNPPIGELFNLIQYKDEELVHKTVCLIPLPPDKKADEEFMESFVELKLAEIESRYIEYTGNPSYDRAD